MTTRTHDGNGRFTRTVRTARRDLEAAELRARGRSFQRIADDLGLASKGHAHDAVSRALASLPSDGAEEARRLDLERLDRLIEVAWGVMERPHLAVSNGRVVRRRTGETERDDDGFERLDDEGKTIPVYEDVMDDGPTLQAIDRIRALLERRAKILGYDAPSRKQVEVITAETVDAEIARLEAELGCGGTL
jgi:hypothetical protein